MTAFFDFIFDNCIKMLGFLLFQRQLTMLPLVVDFDCIKDEMLLLSGGFI